MNFGEFSFFRYTYPIITPIFRNSIVAKELVYKHIVFQQTKQKVTTSAGKITATADLQLWQEFQRGNESAFATIYKQNVALLYSYGIKLINDKELVKDNIQDLFIELWNAKNRLAKVQSIKSYLYKSLRRKLIASASKRRKRFDGHQNLDNLDKKTSSVEVRLIEKQHFDAQRQLLDKALALLSDKQKELIHLKFYGRLSYNEISKIMFLSKKGVYNLMARTIKSLKQYLMSLVLLGIPPFML